MAFERKIITAPTPPTTKAYLDADSQLAQLEQQLEKATAEVQRLQLLVNRQRQQTDAAFSAALDAGTTKRR